MAEHPIQGLMSTALENLKEMVDVNTIIGDPIETPDGSTVILPVSKVGFGFAAGGSEFKGQKQKSQEDSSDNSDDEQSSKGSDKLPFGGGSGGGVSISPVAFLIVNQNGVKMVHLNEQAHLYERLLDLAPQAVEKIQELFKSQKKSGEKDDKKKKESSKESKKDDENDEEKPPPMKL
ncbi:GerW family sporulation protein [Salirhabdus sp. Marseille-P4669]|uniref:GerW family sporulation protein n=1 Tax=Salirhabdus sp. Marseille-P4669 TaxID=2042310 RepID=UPI000C79ED57|nr:GerW family sporulation protein [Salirhabdus sp. Marseille-P4669]